MPLSQDFVNSRLEYLQSSLKNDKVVASQFYPRFQMQYNEMFPFVEGSIAKIQNPQQPVVNSALKAPTLEMVEENLKSFLIPYVGDKADTVIKGLTNAQKFYYEANFDEIQKELLKRIQIPTNIQSYSANLKMVLASDKNRSNLSVLEPQPSSTKSKTPKITPTIQTPAQRKTRPLTPYFTAAAKPQNPPRLKSASLSSPRKNLKRTMTRVRRSESDNLLNDTYNILQPQLNPALFNPALISELGGFGLTETIKVKKPRFTGRGSIKGQSREIKHKKEFHKYAVDLKKLHHNVLALKYLKNANNVATFKPIEISDNFKEIIEKFLYDGEKIDTTDFDTLTHTEKRILKRMNSFLKLDFDFDYDDHFQDRFQVMYGSFLAGNDNHELKRELKEYVKLAAHENIISQKEAHQMLQKLDK